MPSDYKTIRSENEKAYGTDIGRVGELLLSNRYDDRTHFIYELLQNAEDALARRKRGFGPRQVKFYLTQRELRVSHFGEPFDEQDVRGICGIGVGSKGITDIGRFGIGFKSVYAFASRPEIHSGSEDFAIENYVWPVGTPPIRRDQDETVFVLPLRGDRGVDAAEITRGFRRLNAATLLFLRQIEEISWTVQAGPSGFYIRTPRETFSDLASRVKIVGNDGGVEHQEGTWLIFSRPVATDDGQMVGHVELAFRTKTDDEGARSAIERLSESPLVVFFPTILDTHLGFMLQGPFRTTPSRDNVPYADPWNQGLVATSRALLVDALRWMRDNGWLNETVLSCLPIDSRKFGESTMFAPLYSATRDALMTETLLPALGSGFLSAGGALLARTQEVRDLMAVDQVRTMFQGEGKVGWLSAGITPDRTPELRNYLMWELDIEEIDARGIVRKLDQEFLERQPDQWIQELYEFLNNHRMRSWGLGDLPLVRVEDGSHVAAQVDGQPQAFLPSAEPTDFPTVRREVCRSQQAREFLEWLGLTEPDPVDDVVRNVLPKYQASADGRGDRDYAADWAKVVRAHSTDSKEQQKKLMRALRDTRFVAAIDLGTHARSWARPQEVYFPTERLKRLFAGVRGVLALDEDRECLRTTDVHRLLEECGTSEHLSIVSIDTKLSSMERQRIREEARHPGKSREGAIDDFTVRGLGVLLALLPNLEEPERRIRATLLWVALCDLAQAGGGEALTGTYRWFHYTDHSAPFHAEFVRELNERPWIPSELGRLDKPESVTIESLGWKHNPILEAAILFKPSGIDTLASAFGIEPAVLELLREHGITNLEVALERLGLK